MSRLFALCLATLVLGGDGARRKIAPMLFSRDSGRSLSEESQFRSALLEAFDDAQEKAGIEVDLNVASAPLKGNDSEILLSTAWDPCAGLKSLYQVSRSGTNAWQGADGQSLDQAAASAQADFGIMSGKYLADVEPSEMKYQAEGLWRIACAKHMTLSGRRPCKPWDFDLKGLAKDKKYFDTFAGPKEAGKDVKTFVEHLGDNEKLNCYHINDLPGYSSNHAVLVGMCPAEAHGRKTAFLSVQGDLCHTYAMLLNNGYPRKNIVVMTYHDAFDSLQPDASVAHGRQAQTIDNGLWHQSTGTCKSEKCESNLKKRFNLNVKTGVGHLCNDLPIDYSARITPNLRATVEEKYQDMRDNDLVKVQTLRAALLGDYGYITTACNARTDTALTRCSGRVLRTTRWDKVLLHMNGHGGSNEQDIAFLTFEMNALFLGSTEYPEKMASLLVRDKTRFVAKASDFMSKAWLGTPKPKAGNWLLQSMLNYVAHDTIAETVREGHTNGRWGQLAIYINACESGGLFDEESGAAEYLAQHNTIALVAAPKGESSSTFGSSLVKMSYATPAEDALTSTARTEIQQGSVQVATYFGRFWIDGVMRGNPLLTSVAAEHENMHKRGRSFLSWKKQTKRRKGFPGAVVYDFNPQLFGPTSVTSAMSGDFVVAPFWKSWMRNQHNAVAETKFQMCVNSLNPTSRADMRQIDDSDWKRAVQDVLAEKVYDPIARRIQASYGNRSKAAEFSNAYENAFTSRQKMKTVMGHLEASGVQLTAEEKEYGSLMKGLGRMERYIEYHVKWMDGDFKSQTFRKLGRKCKGLYSGDPMDKNALAKHMCSCIGYAPGDAATPPPFAGPLNLKVDSPMDDYMPPDDDSADELIRRAAELEVQCVKAANLKRETWFGNAPYCKIRLNRGLHTKIRERGTKADEHVGGVDKKGSGDTVDWSGNMTTGKFIEVNDMKTAGNIDTLVLSVYAYSRLGEDPFLGEVSMSVGALLGTAGVLDDTLSNRSVEDALQSGNSLGNSLWKEFTLPLHRQYEATRDEIKTVCKDVEVHQDDYCASHAEWIPDAEALSWQLRHRNHHWLHSIKLVTPPSGKPQSINPGSSCPPHSKTSNLAGEARGLVRGNTSCTPKYYSTELSEKKRVRTPPNLGTLTFRVRAAIKPEAPEVDDE